MKKVLVLMMALVLSIGSQAQLGGLVRKAVKAGLEQQLNIKQNNPKVQDEVQEPQQNEGEKDNRIPTPEEVMAMVPQLPSAQQLADYACEQHRDNPRTLKMLANPTTAFMTQMVAATASGYVVMMNGSKAGNLYSFDEHLFQELGISEEKYNAMSEEERQQLATEYAAELQDRYLRTAERLASDKKYNEIMTRYTAVEDEITKKYNEVDSLCRDMWQKQYGAKEKVSEADLCNYFKEAVPLQYQAVLFAMKTRQSRQLSIAKEMDEYVKKMAASHPGEVYAGFYNQGGVCATAYVSDAVRLTTISDPR